MHKKLTVYFYGRPAGDLSLYQDHYQFAYRQEYLLSPEAEAISLSFPLTSKAFCSPNLFPFFEGLLTEGWLKSIQEQIQHLDQNDGFNFLAKNGLDLIGAITLKEDE